MLFYWLEPKLIKECILKEHLGDYNKRPNQMTLAGYKKKWEKQIQIKLTKLK